GPRHEVEGSVRFLPELEAIALVEPGQHALGVHAERDGLEPFERGLLRSPIVRRAHERLDDALGGGVEALERRHDLAAREDIDPGPARRSSPLRPSPAAGPRPGARRTPGSRSWTFATGPSAAR